jgi:hypothetical protein
LPRVAVILSSGRTGTQFLARYFDANYEDVVARHEPPPSRWIRVLSNAAVAGALAPSRLLPLLSRFRARRVAALGPEKTLYLESNGFLYGFTEVLADLWPDVSVVHVVRDPRDWIRSALAHGNDRGIKWLAGAFVPYWNPDPRRLPAGVAPDESAGLIGRYAAAWTVINQTIENARSACPNYLRLRFEDLVDERASGLRDLCDHLSLPFREGGAIAPDERFNASQRESVGDWQDWSASECRCVDRICGPLMREYGYGDEPEWRERLGADA